ncbi:MAG: FG-GAP repeat protein [Candidatus Electronema sp. V4]|uniref:FG-GAP repeat protein n=1 Tax=Candidatus Electronema sp. V4 TaxID=3454756 RepID=UPI0040558B2E
MSSDTVLIGAPYDDDKGSDFGSAYVFSFPCGYGRALPANTWLMTASACVPADPPGTSINAQYGDDIPGGVYGTNWISYTWEGPTQSYVVMQGADPLAPGLGSWLYSTNAGVVGMTSGTATPTTNCAGYGLDQCFEIELVIPAAGQNRWNFVGHPFPYAVNWADVKVAMSNNGGATWAVYSPSQAEAAGYISKTYFRWSGNAYESYDDVTLPGVLRPQEAVWVRSLGSYSGPAPQKLKLLIPAQ